VIVQDEHCPDLQFVSLRSMPRVECLVHPPHLAPGRQQRKLSRQRPQVEEAYAGPDVLDIIIRNPLS